MRFGPRTNDGARPPAGCRQRRRLPRARHLLGAIRLIALIAIVLGALAVREALALRRDVLRAREEPDSAAAVADPFPADFGSFRDAGVALGQSSTHLSAADTALVSAQHRLDQLGPAVQLGRRLPGWPRGLSEIESLLAAARDLADAGLTLSEAFTRMTGRIDQSADPDGTRAPVGARLADGLAEAEPGFRHAQAAIARAVARRQTVRVEHLTGPLRPARSALETFDRRIRPVQDDLELLVQLPAAARAVLGMEGARTYAVLGQNSAELRPTGGFIGSLGLITIEHGAITVEDYRGSYTFDNPRRGFNPMPAPLVAHLGGGGWALRDANWSPDFPTTARTVEDMLLRQQNVRVDGVIAFNTFTVGMLLDTLGPVQVEGFAEPVTAATWYALAEKLIYFTEPNAPAERNKGVVLEPLLQAVVRRVQDASADELPLVLKALQRAAHERQLFVRFKDPAPAGMARRYQADGRFAPPPTGDVLAVVDANLSYSKIGPYIQEHVRYDVWLNGRGAPEAGRVTVTYINRVTPQQARDPGARIYGAEWDPVRRTLRETAGIYGTYARVYVPRNSRLIDTGDDPAPVLVGQDLGFTTIEGYYRILAGATGGFSYGYQIPTDRSAVGSYRLHVIKQSGTAGHQLEIHVHLPRAARLRGAPSLPMDRDGDTLVYRSALTANLDLRVDLAISEAGP